MIFFVVVYNNNNEGLIILLSKGIGELNSRKLIMYRGKKMIFKLFIYYIYNSLMR